MTVPPFPTHIQIQTTSACGAACSICPHPVESPNWSNGLMTDELFERIVEQLAGRAVDYLCPYLMADPLSDRKIFDRLNTLRAALPETHFELSTTGLYLVPRKADQLLGAPLSELRLSSHGTTAEEWSKTMPGVRHDRGWPNMMAFIDRWRETRPYPLRIVTLRGLWSSERELEIDAFWSDMGIDTIKWDVISRADQVDLTVFGHDGPNGHSAPRQPMQCRFKRDTQWMNILSDGRLTLCCMDYKHESIAGSLIDASMANATMTNAPLKTPSIEAAWRSEQYNQLRRMVSGVDPSDASFLCNRCEWHVPVTPTQVTTVSAERQTLEA